MHAALSHPQADMGGKNRMKLALTLLLSTTHTVVNTCVVRPNPSTRLLTPICREKAVNSHDQMVGRPLCKDMFEANRGSKNPAVTRNQTQDSCLESTTGSTTELGPLDNR